MPTLYTSCLETLEVQIKITTACILNPYYHTKQPRFIRLIFYFSLNIYNCVSFINKYSIVQVSVQKTCKTEVLTHFHIFYFAFISFFFFKHFCNMLTCNAFFFFFKFLKFSPIFISLLQYVTCMRHHTGIAMLNG